MSKVEIVRDSLEKKERDREMVIVKKPYDYEINDELIFEKLKKSIYLPPDNFDFRYYLAPKKEIYTADRLNEFMINLVPGLEPDSKQLFKEIHSTKAFGRKIPCHRLELGHSIYIENFGEINVKRFIRLTDEFLRTTKRFENRKELLNEDKTDSVYTRIFIYPYPNEEIARDYISFKPHLRSKYFDFRYLRTYKQSPNRYLVS